MPAGEEHYRGREQSYLKHRLLKHYVEGWAQKMASMGRRRPVRMWYIDAFAGPWEAADPELEDTSIATGLQAISDAT